MAATTSAEQGLVSKSKTMLDFGVTNEGVSGGGSTKPPKKPAEKKTKTDKENHLDVTHEDPLEIFHSIDGEVAKGGGKKRLSVERIYQKKTQLEHILLRPDTYIGSIEPHTQQMWVYEQGLGAEEEGRMALREATYVPGLYKIFDEILVNAADNKQRDRTMNTIKVNINQDKNEIAIWNNGKGIPVVHHQVEKMYVPEMIFGTLLTSSNYDDSQRKVTGDCTDMLDAGSHGHARNASK